jgi:hypothetical protein
MRRAAIVLVLVVAAVGAFVGMHRGSDQDAIRAQLTRLAAALHASEGSNPVFRVPRVRSEFDAILDETVHVTAAEAPGLPTDRRGLADSAVQLSAFYSSVDVGLRNVEIKLDDSSTMAQVAATADLSAGGEQSRRDTRAVNFLFYKRDGTWRITSVTVWAPDATR